MKLDDLVEAIKPTLSDRLRAELFRRRRVRLLTSDESPLPLATGCQVFLHVLPLAGDKLIDYRNRDVMTILTGLGNFSDTSLQGFNFDGYRRYAMNQDGVTANVQYFRFGAIESCRVYSQTPVGDAGTTYIPSDLLEAFITFNASENVEALGKLGYKPPYIVFVTLMGLKGWLIPKPSSFSRSVPIDRNELWMDGIICDGTSESLELGLTLCIDMLWNAGGFIQSSRK